MKEGGRDAPEEKSGSRRERERSKEVGVERERKKTGANAIAVFFLFLLRKSTLAFGPLGSRGGGEGRCDWFSLGEGW